MLSGGTGQFGYAMPITANRFWVNHTLSAQFLVIYRKLFRKILSLQYDETIIADMAYSEMTSNKMVIYPFISLQKYFGYSDVTAIHNEDKQLVQLMFAHSRNRFENIHTAYNRYVGVEQLSSIV